MKFTKDKLSLFIFLLTFFAAGFSLTGCGDSGLSTEDECAENPSSSLCDNDDDDLFDD